MSLDTFACYSCDLFDLDVSGNQDLKALFCSNNKLRMLDLSLNKELMYIECDNNNLILLRFYEINNEDLRIFCNNLFLKLSPRTVSDILSRMKSMIMISSSSKISAIKGNRDKVSEWVSKLSKPGGYME